MCAQHLQGKRVRLVALKSDSDVEMMARWPAMSGVWRLLDAASEERHGLDQSPAASGMVFRVHALAGDRPIGHARLFGICPVHGDAWLDVNFHRREHWNAPLGADTLQVLLRYAFGDLNLRRVALGMFEYDAQLMRAYEEAGFAIEGRMLEEANQGARRRAGLLMELRREVWDTRIASGG